ncbi:hypothetical protein EJ08DRAFT_662885 [Tothia fuscella]|uniref:CENP-T/Histone H4 histone fold domain-containing protein n=1 Tax=Tothia fuscella TaxID=1048955 RepID=A0A9P4NMX9_9PEZI|nr:hypothetical protein EJ08DRAFT_662885 [Tothia fuscella]
MSEPNRKRPRITEDLALLGKTLHKANTPTQRTPTAADSKSTGRNVFVRTPGSVARTPTIAAGGNRATTVRRGKPTTPHAIRALQQRRNAALTPARDRRRSGRAQRETPRDDLRALSKILAKTSKPIEPSPHVTEVRRHNRSILRDGSESPVLDRAPRLSMPLGELDDDSFHENPPRMSYPLDGDLDDELEGGRRALFGDRMRRARISLGDPSLGDLGLDREGEEEEGEDELTGDMGLDDDGMGGELRNMEAEYVHHDRNQEVLAKAHNSGETGELRAFIDSRRQSEPSGVFDTGRSPGTDGEPTFVFTIPERRRTPLPQPTEQQDDYPDQEQDDADVGAQPNEDWSDVEEATTQNLRRDSTPVADDGRRTATKKGATRVRKELKVSKYGIQYPSMPPTVIKRLASTFSRSYGGSGKLNKETLESISQASDWFFEQVSEDLSSYADHAGRKTIEEADVVALMKRYRTPFLSYGVRYTLIYISHRQRQINATTTPFSLAQKFLPRELVQEIRMAARGNIRKRKRPRMETIEEEDE